MFSILLWIWRRQSHTCCNIYEQLKLYAVSSRSHLTVGNFRGVDVWTQHGAYIFISLWWTLNDRNSISECPNSFFVPISIQTVFAMRLCRGHHWRACVNVNGSMTAYLPRRWILNKYTANKIQVWKFRNDPSTKTLHTKRKDMTSHTHRSKSIHWNKRWKHQNQKMSSPNILHHAKAYVLQKPLPKFNLEQKPAQEDNSWIEIEYNCMLMTAHEWNVSGNFFPNDHAANKTLEKYHPIS